MFFFLLSLGAESYYKKRNSIMDVTTIPFNQFIGLKYADNPDYLLMLDDSNKYHNHLGTVHASAMFALAEASSGLFLQNEFSGVDNIVPVVRKSEIKFKKPANGKIYSRARFGEVHKEEILQAISDKKRVAITVVITLVDQTETMVMQATFDWVVLPGS